MAPCMRVVEDQSDKNDGEKEVRQANKGYGDVICVIDEHVHDWLESFIKGLDREVWLYVLAESRRR